MTEDNVQRPTTWRTRAGALLVSGVLLAAVWSPVLEPPSADSFPISSYPMFSRKRPAVAAVAHAIGVRADGTREVLAPSDVGSSEVLQAKVIIQRTVQRGRRAARKLCREIAGRVHDRYERVEIRTDKYRVLPYFDGDRSPIRTRMHARCRTSAVTQ